MISWTAILAATVGGTAGAAYGTHRAKRAGKPHTLLPFWAFVLLTAVGIAAAVCFIESAAWALDTPSRAAVWMMIASATLFAVSLTTQMTLEFRKAWAKLQQKSG